MGKRATPEGMITGGMVTGGMVTKGMVTKGGTWHRWGKGSPTWSWSPSCARACKSHKEDSVNIFNPTLN